MPLSLHSHSASRRCQNTSDPGHFGPKTFQHHQTDAKVSRLQTVRRQCRSVQTVRHQCRSDSRTLRHWYQTVSTSSKGCQSIRHTVNSSPGRLVTRSTHHRSTHHRVDSSRSRLVTKRQSTRHKQTKHQSRTAAAVITNYPYPIAAITQKMHKKLSRKQSEQQSTCSVLLTARVNLRPLLKPTAL